MLFLTLLAALQVAAPVKPAKPLDPKDAKSVAEHAIYATRTQERYETFFKVKATLAGGDISYEGTSVSVGQGLLIECYSGSGGRDVRAIRAGASVWMFDHRLEEWVDTAWSNETSIARGLHDPDEVLDLLTKHLDLVKPGADGSPEVSLTGKLLAAVIKANSALGNVDPDKSQFDLKLGVDKSGRVESLGMSGIFLATLDGKSIKNTYEAEVKVTGYNGKGAIQVTNAKGKVLKFNDDIEKAIQAATK